MKAARNMSSSVSSGQIWVVCQSSCTKGFDKFTGSVALASGIRPSLSWGAARQGGVDSRRFRWCSWGWHRWWHLVCDTVTRVSSDTSVPCIHGFGRTFQRDTAEMPENLVVAPVPGSVAITNVSGVRRQKQGRLMWLCCFFFFSVANGNVECFGKGEKKVPISLRFIFLWEDIPPLNPTTELSNAGSASRRLFLFFSRS